MKRILTVLLMAVMVVTVAVGQQKAKKFYDESLDPIAQIDEAVAKANAEGKYVICQFGGNWCPWCVKFGYFVEECEEIRKVIEDNFVYIHVNFSSAKDEKSKIANKRLANAGRFGYPVLVILREDGSVMHIQNSSYLEEEKSYNRTRVKKFFEAWTPSAVKGE